MPTVASSPTWSRLLAMALGLLAVVSAGSAAALPLDDEFIITSQRDADQLARHATVHGSVTVVAAASGSISLRGVETITGDLRILASAGRLTTLEAIDLSTVGGALAVLNPDIRNLTVVPALSVGRLVLQDASALSTLRFSNGLVGFLDTGDAPLASDTRARIVVSNTALSSLENLRFPWLDSMTVEHNPELTDLTLPCETIFGVATTSNRVYVGNNANLEGISFPNLKNISGDVAVSHLRSWYIPELEQIEGNLSIDGVDLEFSAPKLVNCIGNEGDALSLSGIATINMPQLHRLETFKLEGNDLRCEDVSMPMLEHAYAIYADPTVDICFAHQLVHDVSTDASASAPSKLRIQPWRRALGTGTGDQSSLTPALVASLVGTVVILVILWFAGKHRQKVNAEAAARVVPLTTRRARDHAEVDLPQYNAEAPPPAYSESTDPCFTPLSQLDGLPHYPINSESAGDGTQPAERRSLDSPRNPEASQSSDAHLLPGTEHNSDAQQTPETESSQTQPSPDPERTSDSHGTPDTEQTSQSQPEPPNDGERTTQATTQPRDVHEDEARPVESQHPVSQQ